MAIFALAYGKAAIGQRLDNFVLCAEARITLIDGVPATAGAGGVALNAAAGVWWADPMAALVLVPSGAREAQHAWREANDIEADARSPKRGAPISCDP